MKKILIFWLLFSWMNISALHAEVEIDIEKRQLHLENFPCMKCHVNIKGDGPFFPLKAPHHKMGFKHHKKIKSCYLCHAKDNMNSLRMQDGEKISFNDSHRLCLQCHVSKRLDWKEGIHGKQVGKWNGKKYRFSCTQCHNPHIPKPIKVEADPGPKHPGHMKGVH